MDSQVSFDVESDICIITIDSPPVNALSKEVTAGLSACVEKFASDSKLRALVICCAGRTFVAGGDLRSFDQASFDPGPYNRTLARIEALDKPVVAAMHGTTLGGGLELALACHFRIAMPTTKLGFPEITVGVLPGSLGTQRLPRLVALPLALDLMLTGRSISSAEALTEGLLDAVEDAPSSRELGVRLARRLLSSGSKPRPTRALAIRDGDATGEFFNRILTEVEARQSAYPAARAIVTSVEAGVRNGFDVGERVEAQLFEECRRSRESRAMRHLFFATRAARRLPGLSLSIQTRAVRKIGVVGAGTMGAGIAMNFANIGIPVVLVEAKPEALNLGMSNMRRNYEASAAKGRLASQDVQARMSCIKPSLRFEDLGDCDLVIEAVFEDMSLKQQVMARLDEVCKSGAILATNTSTLDVDVIAASTSRAADVIGMHFFSPANVMRLLEVVRGAATASDVLLTVMNLAHRIGKVAVVSGVCYGFIGNRMAEQYMRENEFLLMEGASPSEIDSAVEDADWVGMAMGPCRMLDMAGIDVGAKTLIELEKAGRLPPDPSYRAVCRKLYADGRAGQKSGTGYYRYEGRKPLTEPLTTAACAALADSHGIQRRESIPRQEIVDRLMMPLINEAAKLLDEGIALRPGDIDVVWTAGYGFPDHRGGPLWMADEWGLKHVVDRLNYFSRVRGNPYGYWTPSPLLVRLAEEGRRISEFSRSERHSAVLHQG